MPSISIYFGVLLMIVGVAGYIAGVVGERTSLTALIPAVFGLFLVIFGLVARSNEALRKHMMHAAAAVALIGFLATAGRLLSRIGEITFSPAVLSQAATAVLCLAFVLLAVRSFIEARRSSTT